MNKRYVALKQLIETKNAKVGVIGLGYVGLPLAIEMVKNGFIVYGIDIDETKLMRLQNGKSYIVDVSDQDVQQAIQSGRFYLTAEEHALKWLDAVIICVPTPLSENQDPDTSHIHTVVEKLKRNMENGPLVILESTTYPGTTEELIQWELEKIGLHAGKDYFLCFSPERVDPSNRTYKTCNTPKVIGGTTPQCLELGSLLYRSVVKEVVPVSSPKVAEMCKLLENTFRSVNIAFINEMAMMCEKMGINVWEVIQAASTKPFGFMPFYPGPGIGGHCIPLDPMYLSWKAKGYRFYSKFIDLAQAINKTMPDYVINKTAQILNLYAKSVKNSRVLLLGMAYKPDVDDVRESPGLEAYELFKANGALVDYCDPFTSSFTDRHGQIVKSVPYDPERFRQYDCIVVITNHSVFDYRELAKLQVAILDTRNAFQGLEQPHIYKLGAPLTAPQPVQLQMA